MPMIMRALFTVTLAVTTFWTSDDCRSATEMDTGTKVQLNIATDFLSCAKVRIDNAILGLPDLRIGDSNFANAEQVILGKIGGDCMYKLDRNTILLAFSNDEKMATGFVQGLLLSVRSLIYIGFFNRDRTK